MPRLNTIIPIALSPEKVCRQVELHINYYHTSKHVMSEYCSFQNRWRVCMNFFEPHCSHVSYKNCNNCSIVRDNICFIFMLKMDNYLVWEKNNGFNIRTGLVPKPIMIVNSNGKQCIQCILRDHMSDVGFDAVFYLIIRNYIHALIHSVNSMVNDNLTDYCTT